MHFLTFFILAVNVFNIYEWDILQLIAGRKFS